MEMMSLKGKESELLWILQIDQKPQIKTTQHKGRLLRCETHTESWCEEVSQSDRTVTELESESCERVKSAATGTELL